MTFVSALVAGALFGCGLLLSGMTNPAVVLDFLDVSGDWNPALAFTMAGAIAVAAPAFWLARRRGRTLTDKGLALADTRTITPALVGGSALFGLGWGLTGICPGPGLLLATSGALAPLAFVGAMAGGMVAARALQRGGRRSMHRP